MRFLLFLALQIAVFYVSATILRLFFPFDSWMQSPNIAVTLAYGALLIPPLILSRHNKRLFTAISLLAGVWCLSTFLTLGLGSDFIGHTPTFYLAVAILCVFLHGFERWRPGIIIVGASSVVLSVFGLALVVIYGIKPDKMDEWAILGQNALFVLQTAAVCLGRSNGPKITGEGDAHTTGYQTDYRKAA